MTMKRTTIFLDDVDYDAIERIKSEYGVSTLSDAIRISLRIVANLGLLADKKANDSNADA